MMFKVMWLETLSQTVKLADGTELEGMTNGNIDAPAVPITPNRANDDATKAHKVRPRESNIAAAAAPNTPKAGKSHIRGW